MISPFIRLWHKWGIKAGLSIAEQGFFSGANFILHIFLVRWLMPAEYGIFAIAFSVFLFFSSLHQALILVPMSVIGSAYYRDKLGIYMGVSVWIHGGLTLGFAGIFFLIATVMAMKKSLFASSFFGLAIATPLILFFWLFRQACYLETKPNLALKGSLFYVFLLFLGLVIIRRQDWVSPFSALLIMGFAGIASSLISWRGLGVRKNNLSWREVKPAIKDVVLNNWRWGRWGVGTAVGKWLNSLVYLPLVGIFGGLSQVAILRAMQNMVLPLKKIFAALGFLFLPWLSRQRAIQGDGYLRRNLPKFIGINVLLCVSYVIPLVLFRKFIVKFFYGQSYYGDFLWLVPYLGVLVIVESIVHGLYIGLRALEQPHAIFWAQWFGVIFTLSFGLYFVRKLELYGAALGLLLTAILVTIIVLCFLMNRLKPGDRKPI